MECKNCQVEINVEYNFCPYCGIPVEENSPAYFLRKVTEFRRRGKMKDALEHCRKVIGKMDDPYIYKLIGDLCYLIGDIQESIEHYNKSLEIKPAFPDTLYALGIAYFRKGMIKKGIDYFEKCIKENSEFSMAYYWLGHSYYHIGDIDIAIENYEKFIDCSPQSKIAHYHLGIAYHSKGNEEKSLDNFEKLEEEGIEFASLFFWMGNGYFLTHNIYKSIQYLKKSLELNPDEERARSLLHRISETPDV